MLLNDGVTSDLYETWVLTKSDFAELRDKPAYKAFVETCFNGYTVLFLGITADDIAAGGHIENLRAMGVDTCSHFWVTDRSDSKTDRWAQAAGIELITYNPSGGQHTELQVLLDDLRRYVPRDQAPDPIIPSVPPSKVDLPSAEAMRALAPNETRKILNTAAVELLSNPASKADYDDFCKRYREAIHKCWFLSDAAPDNELLNYRLESAIETGGFGTVYKAVDEAGNTIAIKVLRPEIFRNHAMLQSFRRGVRSMRILTERDVPGIVRCRNAYEIPTAVVMDWVDGPNLEQAVQMGALLEWPELVLVAHQLADTVHRGHLLPERVLHRDLRPKNVMLSDYYSDQEHFEVVVLDFDLSWHQGATEQSVTAGRSFSGYLAPEQITPRAGISTRSAAVDAFGLGMTLYFMISRSDPLPSQHRHRDWEESLHKIARSKKYNHWSSLPARFARLIAACTQDDQKARFDFSQIVSELERLEEAIADPSNVPYGDMLAEEIISRIHEGDPTKYQIIQGSLAVEFTTPIGLNVRITPNEGLQRLTLEIRWNDTGTLERKSVGKYVIEKLPSIKQPLQHATWENVTSNYSAGALALSATAHYSNISRHLAKHVEGLHEALGRLHFD